MKITTCFLLLFLSACMTSYNKESVGSLDYPSSYYKSGMKSNGDFRIFSSAGEVTDRNIISRFIASDSATFNSYVDYIGSQPGFWDSVYFSDAAHALVNNNRTSFACIVSRQGSNFLLTRSDTAYGTSYANELSHTLNYYIGQIKPEIYSESLISSTRGEYLFSYTATEKFLLDKLGDDLVAPVIEFIVYKPGSASGVRFVNNTLQNDFFETLALSDTVMIRDCLITYEK